MADEGPPDTRCSPLESVRVIAPAVTLTASIVGGVTTFAGSIGTMPFNVHTVIDSAGDAYVQTTSNQSPSQLATAVS